MNILSYFNPLSNQHFALKDFDRLRTCKKIGTCLITALATIISLPFLGLGGICTFRLMVNFSIKKVDSNHNGTITKTDNLSSKINNKQPVSNKAVSKKLEIVSEIERSCALFMKE